MNVELNSETLKPVAKSIPVVAMKGTEDGHYFVVSVQVGSIQAGGRFLDEDATLCISNGKKGRVRVEGVGNGSREEKFLCSLGLTRKGHSVVSPRHISGVTYSPAQLLSLINQGLTIINNDEVCG
jgi:hypothetical protein